MAGLSRRDRRGLIGFTHIYAENESLLVPLRGLRIEPGRYQARTVSVKWKEGCAHQQRRTRASKGNGEQRWLLLRLRQIWRCR